MKKTLIVIASVIVFACLFLVRCTMVDNSEVGIKFKKFSVLQRTEIMTYV